MQVAYDVNSLSTYEGPHIRNFTAHFIEGKVFLVPIHAIEIYKVREYIG
jgi:hypothetical protein